MPCRDRADFSHLYEICSISRVISIDGYNGNVIEIMIIRVDTECSGSVCECVVYIIISLWLGRLGNDSPYHDVK
jgi:hypothetical protein